jgi:hypothetical protein
VFGDYDFPTILGARDVTLMLNATGGPVTSGDAVAIDHTNPTQFIAPNHLSQHVVIPEMNGKMETWANGVVAPVQWAGAVKVRIDAADMPDVKRLDRIYIAVGGAVKREGSVAATTPQTEARQIGRSMQVLNPVVGTPKLLIMLGRG